jgi:siroheme synthase (precorrin-2 oxidase/ferrochelatase)
MSAPRRPSELRSPRMGNLSRLPVFFALEGKPRRGRGRHPAAAWKAELLSAAGATVDVFAAETSDELRDLPLARRRPGDDPSSRVDGRRSVGRRHRGRRLR